MWFKRVGLGLERESFIKRRVSGGKSEVRQFADQNVRVTVLDLQCIISFQ